MPLDARSEKHLAQINLELAVKVRKILETMRSFGYPMVITDGNRTLEEQKKIYAVGRFGNPGPIVTNMDGVIKKSNHQDGRAVDCAFLDKNGSAYYPNSVTLWNAYGVLGELSGLIWGGRWKSPVDKPHLELPKPATVPGTIDV
jgi:peptidoglycan L-alanyl-D-glutamate endopeptidase CwlK